MRADAKKRHGVSDIPISLLWDLFIPDFERGILRRRVSRGNCSAGSIVGTRSTHGHLSVQLNGLSIYVHRVLWAMRFGAWPERDLDHADGVPDNNSLSNLRECSVSQNIANARDYKRRINLPRGVQKTRNGKYMARLRKDGRLVYLGTFPTADEAAAKYRTEAPKYFGEFARCGNAG